MVDEGLQLHRRRLLRRLGWVLVLVLLGAGWWGVDRLRNPPLVPVTQRQCPRGTDYIFSMNRIGYPAVETYNAPLERVGNGTHRILDDRCRPGTVLPPALDDPKISPTRNVIASYAHDPWNPASHLIVFDWRDGRRTLLRHRLPYIDHAIVNIADSGFFWNARTKIALPDGRRPVFPDGKYPLWYTTLDPTAIPLTTGKATWYINDLATGKPRSVTAFNPTARRYFFMSTLLFRHGARYLVVSRVGLAEVFEQGRLLARLGTPDTHWWWAEDGSVWRQEAGRGDAILHWRTGTPALTPFPHAVPPDPRVLDFASQGLTMYSMGIYYYPALPASWGDGRLVAVAATRPSVPRRVGERLNAALRAMHLSYGLPYEVRTLTLYRDGKRVGTCHVPLAPLHPGITARLPWWHRPPTPAYREHLAFTQDGQYLSWIIDAGRGPQVYVFATRRK